MAAAAKITTGELPDAQLSSNVSLLGTAIDSTEITDDTILNADINTAAAIGWTKIDKSGAVGSDVGLGNVDNIQQMPLTYLDTNNALTADSDTKVPSQKAIKSYVDTQIAASGDITEVTTSATTSGLTGGALTGAVALTVDVDGATMEISGSNKVQVKDGGITDAKLASGIDAAKITTGTLPDARLSTNVTQLGATITSDEVTSESGKYFTYKPDNTACADGQVIKWVTASLRWDCQNDTDTTYTAGTGITLTSTTFNVDALVGDVSGLPTTTVVGKIQGRAVDATAPASSEVLKWDGDSWAPSADADTTYTGGTGLTLSTTTFNVDALVGDVTGLTTTTVVGKIQGRAVDATAPASSEVLKWDGDSWAPSADTDTTYTASGGITLAAGNFTNDLGTTIETGEITSLNVGKIANAASEYFIYKPGNSSCNDGQVLKWANGNAQWECGYFCSINSGCQFNICDGSIFHLCRIYIINSNIWKWFHYPFRISCIPTDNIQIDSAGDIKVCNFF